MNIPLLRRAYPTLEELELQRAQRTMGIRRVIGVSALIFLGFVSFLGSMLILKPMLELEDLKHQKEQAELQLIRAQAEEAREHNRYLWMSDPEYYMEMARDRADMAQENETILRRPSPAELEEMRRSQNNRRPARN